MSSFMASHKFQNLHEILQRWASSPQAEKNLETVFGDALDWAAAYRHLAFLKRGDFSLLPPIDVLAGTSMPTLWGGYSRDLQTVFLSADCPQDLIVPVLLEEIGHFFDQQFCAEETPGDEGAVFSALVLGMAMDSLEAADDALRELNYSGAAILVEAAAKVRGSRKIGRSSGKSGRKKRGSSNGGRSNSGGSSGYAEVGGRSSNPKLQENIIYATEDGARIPQKAAGDRLIGSRGNDSFVVISQDVKIEDPMGGTDTVESTGTFSLANHSLVENLVLTGTGNTSGTGNSKANTIVGNSGNNSLNGGTGSDTIFGGGGSDTLDGGQDSEVDILAGGPGDDSYIYRDTLDQIVEAAGEGSSDTILTTINESSLADLGIVNVENLTFVGTGSATLSGNALANSISGGNESDTIYGENGDTLAGGQGDDWFKVLLHGVTIVEGSNALDGTDTISTALWNYSFANYDNIEVLDYTGARDSSLTGNSIRNTIHGSIAFKNTIDGGEGDDYLIGGDAADTLIGGEGNDTLIVTRWTDQPNVELGTSLRSGTGRDSLSGGNGDDWYVVNSQSAYTFQDTSGANTVASTVEYSLRYNSNIADNIQNLNLIGQSNLNGTGSDKNNKITGNDGNNALTAWDGNDTVLGGLGSDFINGGLGNDIMFGGGQPQTDLPTDASTPINLGVGQSYVGKIETRQDTDWIRVSLEAGRTYYFRIVPDFGSTPQALKENSDIAFGVYSVNFYDTSDNTDLLGLVGDTGFVAATNNVGVYDHSLLVLNSDGSRAFGIVDDKDWLHPNGSFGDPNGRTFRENNIRAFSFTAFDTGEFYIPVTGAGPAIGSYTVYASYSSSLLDPTMPPGVISEVLADNSTNTLIGGAGDDTLVAGNGRDSLGNPVGDLLLGDTNLSPGSAVALGDQGDDSMVGSDGDDTLDGGGGKDVLRGGKGNDLYYYYAGTKAVIEEIGEGNDTLISAVNINLADDEQANVEVYALSGSGNNSMTGNNDANVLYGNVGNNTLSGLAGKDSLFGGAGQDTLDGGDDDDYLDGGISAELNAGDTMNGGWGNDTYVVYNRYDQIIEEQDSLASDDIDTVLTYVNFDPLANEDLNNVLNNVTRSKSFASNHILSFALLDNFVFMGDAIRGVGNAKDNSFTGNYENNVILGLDGDDTIFGGAGNDSIYGDRERNFLSGTPGTPGTPGYDSVSGTYPFNPGDYDTTGLVTNAVSFAASGTSGEGMDYLDGGEGDDLISGNSKNDILFGGAGNDILIGGADIDSMVGGAGDDTMYRDHIDDITVEKADEGADWVFSKVTIPQLGENIENAVIYGPLSGANFFAVGNSVDNQVYVAQKDADEGGVTLSGGIGNDSLYGYFNSKVFGYAEISADISDLSDRVASDYLVGGDGNDYIDGGNGVDTLEGGLGNDTIVVNYTFDARSAGGSWDRILEFGYEGDPTNGGIDWVIRNGGIIDLKDVVTDAIFNGAGTTQQDFVENGMLVENLQGFSATLSGNWLNNTILGGAGNTSESLSGELGNDFLCGVVLDGISDGSDYATNYVSGGVDTLTGGQGSDIFSLRDDDGRHLYFDGGHAQGLDLTGNYALITDYSAAEVLRGIVLPDGFDASTTTQVSFVPGRVVNFVIGGVIYNRADYIVDGALEDLITVYKV